MKKFVLICCLLLTAKHAEQLNPEVASDASKKN